MNFSPVLSGPPAERRGHVWVLRVALVAISLLAAIVVGVGSSPSAGAEPGDIGHEGIAYVEAANPTVSKPESKLWFNDGSWWAVMAKPSAPTSTGTPKDDLAIYRLDVASQTWVATDTIVDKRATAKSDALWDGTHLYVATHKFTGNATGVPEAPTSNNQSRLAKFTYDATSRTYQPVEGFPAEMNPFQMESLSIDRDSTGVLWAAWVQASGVFYQSSVDGGATWSTATALSDPRAATTSDDVATVVAFGGNKVGIMWADQATGNDGFWFSVHADGAGADAWSPAEAAFVGAGVGDDHINVKAAPNGHVYAAVKSRNDTGTKPLVVLLDRAPNGTWSQTPAWLGSTNVTRPILQVDAADSELHLFVTGPEASSTNGEDGGSIYRKSTPMGAPSFTADALGEAVMARPGSSRINDASGSKQPATAASGLAVIAADSMTQRYWHHFESGVPVAPSAPGGVVAEPGDGRVLLRWTAATPGSSPITGYRVTATPALGGSGFVDFGVGSPGVEQVVSVPNYVERVFHVVALGGVVGPATSSLPVMPVGWLPFSSSDAFADQQARDFSGASVATSAVRDDVRSRFVESGQPASQVVAEVFLAAPEWAGDNDGQAARVTRLYFAYFLRPPDRGGMDYWVRVYQGGRSLERISQSFATSSEFVRRYGALDDEQFLELVYRNLFDRDPDPGGRAYWLRKLGEGLPRGSMMTKFSESSEYRRTSKDQVYVSLVYRALYGRPPSPAELAVELAKPDSGVARTITDILASSRYRQRVTL